MATLTIKTLERPKVFDAAAGDEVAAPHLRFELVTGAGEELVAVLPFADYAGLEAEWEAGTATTILEASLDAWLAANGFHVAVAELTGAQASWAAAYQPEVA